MVGFDNNGCMELEERALSTALMNEGNCARRKLAITCTMISSKSTGIQYPDDTYDLMEGGGMWYSWY